MTPSASDIQQHSTVRINVNGSIGSGAIMIPEAGDNIYILTAKHVIYGKQFTTPFNVTDIRIEEIFSPERTMGAYALSNKDRVISNDDNQFDWAVIVIDKKRFLPLSFIQKTSDAIDESFGLQHCILRGFPAFAGNNQNRSVTGEFNEVVASEPFYFLVEAARNLDTIRNDINENVDGMSGGGVFVNYEQGSYLLGVIAKFTPIDTFRCVRVSAINALLKANHLTGIPITQLIVDPAVKSALKALRDNRKDISAKINDKIGTVHLQRTLDSEIVEKIKSKKLTIIYGAAGAGKSAYAKEIILSGGFSEEFEILAFTGEQFAHDSIEQVMNGIDIHLSVDTLFKLSGLKRKKLFWIESTEKLLETGKIDAFADLLSRSLQSDDLSIVVTVRNYQLQQFKLQFSWIVPKENITAIAVPVLYESEQQVIVKSYPGLSKLLANPKLRELMKVPFYLKYAVAVLPMLEESEDLNELDFKRIMWEQIIEAREKKRGQMFEAMAVKRAKEMSLFTVFDSEQTIVSALLADNLVVQEKDSLGERYSPAHDILEDWALVRYMIRNKRNYAVAKDFFASIGNEPAIRRAYRLWLGEALQNIDTELIDFIKNSIQSNEIDVYWKDETCISILRSDYAENYFRENQTELIADEGKHLLKWISLLNTACVENNTETGRAEPVGKGWAVIVTFINQNRLALQKLYPYFLGFLLKWKRKLYAPQVFTLPEESRDAGLLLLDIIRSQASNYNGSFNRAGLDDNLDDGCRLLVRLTGAITEEMSAFLDECKRGKEKTSEGFNYKSAQVYDLILDIVIDGIDGLQAAIYLPDKVIALVQERLVIKPKETGRFASSYDEKIEHKFGIEQDYDFSCSPPSSYQTPMLTLLRNHFEKAIPLIIKTINDATEAFRKSTQPHYEFVDISLLLNNDKTIAQTGNYILWTLYRGFHHGPDYLKSILMALETYLLEMAKYSSPSTDHYKLRSLFDIILENSTSVATTSVLASVSMAFPEVVGERFIPLVSDINILEWEMARFTSEMPTHAFLLGDKKDLHENERRKSNELPHRKIYKGLNQFFVDHQFKGAPLTERYNIVLDRLKAQVVKMNSVIASKIMHEIDTRTWEVVAVDKSDTENHRVLIGPKYEGAAKEFVDEGQREMQATNMELVYTQWIDQAFKQTSQTDNYEKWKEAYTYYAKGQINERLFYKPGTLALIGLRDFEPHLTNTEKKWCLNEILSLAELLMSDRNRSSYGFDRSTLQIMEVVPCLRFLPGIGQHITTDVMRKRFRNLLLDLLISGLHPKEIGSVLSGIREDLWRDDQELANKCFLFLVAFAELTKQKQWWRDHYEENPLQREKDTHALKTKILNGKFNKDLSLSDSGTRHYSRAIALIPADAQLPVLRKFVVDMLDMSLDSFGDIGMDKSGSDYDFQLTVKSVLAEMILFQVGVAEFNVFEKLFASYNGDVEFAERLRYTPETKRQAYISELIEKIIYTLDGLQCHPKVTVITANFWLLWERIHQYNIEHKTFHFVSSLLFGINWVPTSTDWKPFENKSTFLSELIDYYGHFGIDKVFNLLSSAGRKTLMPVVISNVAKILRESTMASYLINGQYADRFIQRTFYEYGKRVKLNQQLLSDFIFILDLMVARGSHEAYLIREDVITFKTA